MVYRDLIERKIEVWIISSFPGLRSVSLPSFLADAQALTLLPEYLLKMLRKTSNGRFLKYAPTHLKKRSLLAVSGSKFSKYIRQ